VWSKQKQMQQAQVQQQQRMMGGGYQQFGAGYQDPVQPRMMRQSNYSAMMGGGYQQFGGGGGVGGSGPPMPGQLSLDMRLMLAGPTGQRLLL
jgi:hypothetical protein